MSGDDGGPFTPAERPEAGSWVRMTWTSGQIEGRWTLRELADEAMDRDGLFISYVPGNPRDRGPAARAVERPDLRRADRGRCGN